MRFWEEEEGDLETNFLLPNGQLIKRWTVNPRCTQDLKVDRFNRNRPGLNRSSLWKRFARPRSTIQPQRKIRGILYTAKGRASRMRLTPRDGNESECRSADWFHQEIPLSHLVRDAVKDPFHGNFRLPIRAATCFRARACPSVWKIYRASVQTLFYTFLFFFLSFFLSFFFFNDVETIANGRASSHLWIIGRKRGTFCKQRILNHILVGRKARVERTTFRIFFIRKFFVRRDLLIKVRKILIFLIKKKKKEESENFVDETNSKYSGNRAKLKLFFLFHLDWLQRYKNSKLLYLKRFWIIARPKSLE